jgi:beta-mannanase
MPAFEAYYPGHDVVDVVAFSSYNWGYCVGWEYDEWQLGPELYKPYVDRMRSMAPGKPIFISQTASTTHYPHRGNYDYQKKSEWFADVYTYLTGLDGVRAVLYFNFGDECDWVFFRSGEVYYDGYKQAVASSAFEYLSPPAMIEAFSQP